MIVYHGTSRKNLKDMLEEGVTSPSYWTSDYENALEYAKSWGDPLVISCDTDSYDFRANMLVAELLLEQEEIDQLPDEYDLENSLEYFEGIVCHDRITEFEVMKIKVS